MVMLHVIIAFVSIFLATYSLFKPSGRAIIVDWVLVAATIVSGAILVAMEPARMFHACIAGLAYVALASALTLVASVRYKSLRRQTSNV